MIGLPLMDKKDGTVADTLVTVPLPVPAPIAVLKFVASKAVTVLSALNRGKVIALGLVSVNKLLPTVVAPKLVLAAGAVVAPVPPLAIANVPANVIAPVDVVAGVSPVVPALKDVTKAPLTEVHCGAVPFDDKNVPFAPIPNLDNDVPVA